MTVKKFFARLEFVEGEVDRDTTFALLLEPVEEPCVFEGLLTHGLGLGLHVLRVFFVDGAGVVEQVTDARALTVINVSDDDQVNVWLLFTAHFSNLLLNPTWMVDKKVRFTSINHTDPQQATRIIDKYETDPS